MPFQSDAQRKFLFAKKPSIAKKFVEDAKNMSKGGPVEGEELMPGNSPSNDIVKANLSPGETVISKEDIPSLLRVVKKDDSGNLDKVQDDLHQAIDVLLKGPYTQKTDIKDGLDLKPKVAMEDWQKVLNHYFNKPSRLNFQVGGPRKTTGVQYTASFSNGGAVQTPEESFEMDKNGIQDATVSDFGGMLMGGMGLGSKVAKAAPKLAEEVVQEAQPVLGKLLPIRIRPDSPITGYVEKGTGKLFTPAEAEPHIADQVLGVKQKLKDFAAKESEGYKPGLAQSERTTSLPVGKNDKLFYEGKQETYPGSTIPDDDLTMFTLNKGNVPMGRTYPGTNIPFGGTNSLTTILKEGLPVGLPAALAGTTAMAGMESKKDSMDGIGELGDSTKGLKKIMMDKAKLRGLHKIKKEQR